MKPYPSIVTENLQGVYDTVQFIVRERDNDVRDWNNLPNVFGRGRKVGKIPTGSADVDPTDRIGDFSFDDAYFYLVVDDTGSAAWRRIALASW